MAVAAERFSQQTLGHSTAPTGHEEFTFFDINASIDLMRVDLATVGHVLPETRQRVMDEELTYVAEGINRPLSTKFEFRCQDGALQYFDRGEWKPYMQLLYNGIKATKTLALSDPRKEFLYEMAVDDLANGYAMHNLEPGESKVWCSPFRDDIAQSFGLDFMDDCGFQSHRRMGFIYMASKREDGTVVLESHSVDNSSSTAFLAATEMAENPDVDMEMLVWAYDNELQRQTGKTYSAGRLSQDGVKEQNSWYAIRQHGDLVGLYFSDLEKLARNGGLTHVQTEREKRRLTYGFWAALKDRINQPIVQKNNDLSENRYDLSAAYREAQLRVETALAFQKAAARRESLTGCGGSMRAVDGSFDDLNPEEAFDEIFGKDKKTDTSDETDEYGKLEFKCTEGHTNRRPRHKLITECQTKPCRSGSVGC